MKIEAGLVARHPAVHSYDRPGTSNPSTDGHTRPYRERIATPGAFSVKAPPEEV